MRYVMTEMMKHLRDMTYRIYVTDALYCMGNSGRMAKRYYDCLHPKKEDDRTGDEIAADVINKLGLKEG